MERIRAWRRPGASGVIYCADALEFLAFQRPGSANIVFLDPPFNLGKNYSSHFPLLDHKPVMDYRLWLSEVLNASVRVLAPGGALFLYHLPEWAARIAAELDDLLTFRHWIAISMKNGFVRGDRLYPAHYALLYYTKGAPSTFRRPKLVPQTCRHCGGLIKDYGGYTSIIMNKGLNLSDIWDDISPVRHASKKYRKANELPLIITDRIVEIAGLDNGILYDPFAGSGTTLISAIKGGMRFRACELLPENCSIIVDRINAYKGDNESIDTEGEKNAQ